MEEERKIIKVIISLTIINFRVFGTVRWPQLSKEFLSNTLCNNQFIKVSERCQKMIGKAIEILSKESTDRTASTRHEIEIYVFPIGSQNAQKHIAKLV